MGDEKDKGPCPLSYIIKEENMKCSKCGKNMTKRGRGGYSVIGIVLQLKSATNKKSNREFIRKQLGKYKLGMEYAFCWECWLDSLFGEKNKI